MCWFVILILLTVGCSDSQIDEVQGLLPSGAYPTNENGETYGSALHASSPDQEPDLISAVGDDGETEGYVRKSDLAVLPSPQNPAEALAQEQQLRNKIVQIPLYDFEGERVIGTFTFGSDAGTNDDAIEDR